MTFSLSSLAVVAALAGPALANFNLQPKNYGHKRHNFLPSNIVSMQYGGADTSYVNVSLSTTHPAIMLEELSTVSSVDCDDYSVSVAFNNSAAFKEATDEWKLTKDGLLFITNHLGDCDVELERGFFLADSIASDNKTLTIVAKTTKQQINDTATDIEIHFKGLPQTKVTPATLTSNCTADVASRTKRQIVATPSLTIAHSVSLPPTVLFSEAPLTLTADKATISASATLSGTIRYSILTFTLKEFTVDFDTSLSTELGLDLVLTGAYNATPKYSAPALEYDVISVPGILTIGPELLFDVGVAVAVDAALAATAKVGASITDGNVHIDVLNQGLTTTSGWVPEFTHSVNISENAHASIDPFVDVTVGIACKILDGLLDLSVALEAQPRFNNEFILAATQSESGNATSTAITTGGGSGSCANGVEVVSDFQFSLIAIVTQFWSDTIYSVNVPVANECYNF
ncbi:hypothetical protein F503_06576 [Ophiostoma piceae UAMH 11346]|uniref:DUF7029 domain-containing protein n=1 Tax=Ophiostoma piceae (strain UAMH 11346) TaxID=1262450 RepID=S3CPT3_OPHP1|nr:hypothetical protein F503_06576 [Ophiostoma piceae UAMH 11346]